MNVQPYLFFNGRCEEALEFYGKALGARVTRLMRFEDSPDPAMCGSATLDKVMHGQFQIGDTTILVSDGRCEGVMDFKGFALTINAANPAEAERLFTALSEGGQIQMPLGKTFFAESFGMAADRFGVMWMVIVGK